LQFRILHRSKTSRARLGEIVTSHGRFETPVFMPVGTQGSVKALSPQDLENLGVAILLANTYHLHLRPGHQLIERLGGLHRFMGWKGSILTDSGGFQVYSLARLRTITREGVAFQSHIDGSKCFLGPQEAIFIQQALGSDIMMALDECAPYPADYDYVSHSVDLTSLWARQCREMRTKDSQALFGIVQGGVYPDLREKSARDLAAMNFEGYALGGLSVGEDRETRERVIRETVPFLPEDKPVYLMGVGRPEDILDAIPLGVDMFDCVLPTRNARNGALFTRNGLMVIKNACYREDDRPIEEGCLCYTCSHFSRAYLRHLFMAKELLVYRLNTIHNVHFYEKLMSEIRKALGEGKFEAYRREFMERLQQAPEGSLS
jgi:queuine tRNA-ribosyltransferase